jgi:hypothetical protein
MSETSAAAGLPAGPIQCTGYGVWGTTGMDIVIDHDNRIHMIVLYPGSSGPNVSLHSPLHRSLFSSIVVGHCPSAMDGEIPPPPHHTIHGHHISSLISSYPIKCLIVPVDSIQGTLQ